MNRNQKIMWVGLMLTFFILALLWAETMVVPGNLRAGGKVSADSFAGNGAELNVPNRFAWSVISPGLFVNGGSGTKSWTPAYNSLLQEAIAAGNLYPQSVTNGTRLRFNLNLSLTSKTGAEEEAEIALRSNGTNIGRVLIYPNWPAAEVRIVPVEFFLSAQSKTNLILTCRVPDQTGGLMSDSYYADSPITIDATGAKWVDLSTGLDIAYRSTVSDQPARLLTGYMETIYASDVAEGLMNPLEPVGPLFINAPATNLVAFGWDAGTLQWKDATEVMKAQPDPFVTLTQLEEYTAGGEHYFFHGLSNVVGAVASASRTNWAYPTVATLTTTNSFASVAVNQYLAAYVSSGSMRSIASGAGEVELWCYENTAGGAAVTAEFYLMDVASGELFYEFTPPPASQTVPAGGTPTKLTFSIPLTDYTADDPFRLVARVKVISVQNPAPTVSLVSGGSFPSHMSFQLPGAAYVKRAGDVMEGTLEGDFVGTFTRRTNVVYHGPQSVRWFVNATFSTLMGQWDYPTLWASNSQAYAFPCNDGGALYSALFTIGPDLTAGRTNVVVTQYWSATNASYFPTMVSFAVNALDSMAGGQSANYGGLSVIHNHTATGTNRFVSVAAYSIAPVYTNHMWRFQIGRGTSPTPTNTVWWLGAKIEIY